MTDHLSKQDGRGADSWTLKQRLFALVFCCVPLDVFFWIARLISVPFSLFCHWQVSSCTPPAKASLPSHLLPFLSPLIKVKRGRCQRLLEIHPLGNVLPVCHVVKTKHPFCPSWQVREIISGGNYNWRERGCSGQWYRGCKGREGGRLKHIYPMVRHRSTMPIFTCHVLTHRQTQTENAGAFWGKDHVQSLHTVPALLSADIQNPSLHQGRTGGMADLVNFGFRGRFNQQNRRLGLVQFF